MHRKISTAIVFATALFAASGPGAAAADDAGQAYFRARCSHCHEASGLSKLSPEEWAKRLHEFGQAPDYPLGSRATLLDYVQEHSRKAEGMLAVNRERKLFEEKCGVCHPSARIFMVTLSAEQRRHVVRRMRDHWEGGENWISNEEAEQILGYVERALDEGIEPPREATDGSPKELFRERCSTCHSLERVYHQVKNERNKTGAWIHVVSRMRSKAPDWITEDEAGQIVRYLQSRTTPRAPVPATSRPDNP